jgi:hypothetical protein
MLRPNSPVWAKLAALKRVCELHGRWLATAGRDPTTDLEQDRRWVVALATAERDLHGAIEEESNLAAGRAVNAAALILKPADFTA